MSKNKTTYQCTNRCDCLTIGEHYDAERKPGTRLVRMTSHKTGHVVSLYTWQIEQALLGGALKIVSDALRDSLHSANVIAMLSPAERLQTIESVREVAVVKRPDWYTTNKDWYPE